jgi:hypothetical protein
MRQEDEETERKRRQGAGKVSTGAGCDAEQQHRDAKRSEDATH